MRKCFVNLSLLFIFFACSSNVEIELKDDISGIVSIFINVNKEFEKLERTLNNFSGRRNCKYASFSCRWNKKIL